MRISDWSSDVYSSDLDGSAEQRRRQRRFLDRGHHVECRHRHVPHEPDRERLPNLDNDLPKTWPRTDNHNNYALNLLAIVIRSACSSCPDTPTATCPGLSRSTLKSLMRELRLAHGMPGQ